MRVHTLQPRSRVPSSLSLDNTIDPAALMDTSVPAVFPPAVRRFPYNGLAGTTAESYGGFPEREQDSDSSAIYGTRGGLPTISDRLNGYGRRNNYDENGIEVQLANGDLALIGSRLCRDGSTVSVSEVQHPGVGRGRFEVLKKMCSFGTLSSAGTERSNGTSRTQYWMLLITPVVSSFSLALVIAAVVGPQWLLTEEKIPYAPYHGNTSHGTILPTTTSLSKNQHQLNIQHPHLIPTIKDDGGGTGGFMTKYTRSSLWMLCSRYSGGSNAASGHQQQKQQPQQPSESSEFQCSSIDYFPSEGYSPDPNDSTNAIPCKCRASRNAGTTLLQGTNTVTHSSPFFLASNGVLIVSYGLFLVAICSTKHKICYFASGVLFIISGLLMLIGLIMYISILKAEIGSKLRPRSSLQAPQFTFRYGQSFLLYVFGFIITELSGILNVLIYSNVQQQQQQQQQLDHDDEYDEDGSLYPTYQNLSGGGLQYHNLHYGREWTAHSLDERNKPDGGGGSGGVAQGPAVVDYRYPYDGVQSAPRYYFERRREDSVDGEIDCRVHQQRPSLARTEPAVTKSLTDLLYTEPTSMTASVSVQQGVGSPGRNVSFRSNGNGNGHRLNDTVVRSPLVDNARWSVGGEKLTRSVSTYTDLTPVSTGEDTEFGHYRQRRTRSTNTDDGGEGYDGGEKASKICGISRHYLSRELSKEKLFNEFCKKVGPRPKPKNIYFIESDARNGDEQSYRNVFVIEPSSPVLGSSRPSKHRRRNSMAEMRRRSDQGTASIGSCISYRHRIRSDNSLDREMPDDYGVYYRRREPIGGRARSVDYRQTLPRNFGHNRHQMANETEPEDETGGFEERLAMERKRVSASGLLLEPVRLNASHGDLTSDGTISSPNSVRWHKSVGKLRQPQSIGRSVPVTCPKYLDPPTYSATAADSGHNPSYMYRSYDGDLVVPQKSAYNRRPTILSSQVFSPISQPATPTVIRSNVLSHGANPNHHHLRHGQHHRHHEPSGGTQPRQHSLPSPVFDLDRIEQERRKSHSQLFLNSPASSSTMAEQYDYMHGTAV
ncbi:hypothetical protein AND_009622 [Anopheles darlingi]|uniref:Voltage-dependent calcium channel gamma-5 subunit n=1 Tax=Anopheles darlingi TaxID=43151 RepID=W5J5W5_ANODA|nr:hypothetical protein AND_009622 [Anopheles darlingi]